MKHAQNNKATQSWRANSSTLRAMVDYDRNRRWVTVCGDRAVAPRAVPSGEPDCNKCRTGLGLALMSTPCEDCNGSGEARDRSGADCTACDGLGEVV